MISGTRTDGEGCSRSFAAVFECPVCGVGYNKETARDKGLFCGCARTEFPVPRKQTTLDSFMRRVRR